MKKVKILIPKLFFLSFFLLLACNKVNDLEEPLTDLSIRETAKQEMLNVSEAIRYSVRLNLIESN